MSISSSRIVINMRKTLAARRPPSDMLHHSDIRMKEFKSSGVGTATPHSSTFGIGSLPPNTLSLLPKDLEDRLNQDYVSRSLRSPADLSPHSSSSNAFVQQCPTPFLTPSMDYHPIGNKIPSQDCGVAL